MGWLQCQTSIIFKKSKKMFEKTLPNLFNETVSYKVNDEKPEKIHIFVWFHHIQSSFKWLGFRAGWCGSTGHGSTTKT